MGVMVRVGRCSGEQPSCVVVPVEQEGGAVWRAVHSRACEKDAVGARMHYGVKVWDVMPVSMELRVCNLVCRCDRAAPASTTPPDRTRGAASRTGETPSCLPRAQCRGRPVGLREG